MAEIRNGENLNIPWIDSETLEDREKLEVSNRVVLIGSYVSRNRVQELLSEGPEYSRLRELPGFELEHVRQLKHVESAFFGRLGGEVGNTYDRAPTLPKGVIIFPEMRQYDDRDFGMSFETPVDEIAVVCDKYEVPYLLFPTDEANLENFIWTRVIGRMNFVRGVIKELRELKKFEPTADTDVVWVLSNPGTVYKPSQDGIYKGDMADRRAIFHGIDLVQQITALRLGINPEDVTVAEIEEYGPIFYYNGEGETTAGANYPQNQDLERFVHQPGSPIPPSKVVISDIDRVSTPPQVEDFARFVEDTGFKGKVAVVTSPEHAVARVSRYLEKDIGHFPRGVDFRNYYYTEVNNHVGKTKREVEKSWQYASAGHMAWKALEGFSRN